MILFGVVGLLVTILVIVFIVWLIFFFLQRIR